MKLGIFWQWLGLLLLGCVALLVAIVVFDEGLTPETASLLAAPPNRISDKQNLYLAFMGFDAPPGQSPVAYGQERVAEYERDLEAVQKEPNTADERFSKKNDRALTFKGNIGFVRPLVDSVWISVENHETEIKTLIKNNQELFQRYLALHNMQGYYDLATPSLYTPSAFPAVEIRSLFLADVVLRMKSRDRDQQRQALADLEKDIRTWRAVLIGEGWLVSPMVAVGALHGDYLVLADFIADNTIDIANFSPDLERIVTPFDQTDWKIGKSIAREYRALVRTFDDVDRLCANGDGTSEATKATIEKHTVLGKTVCSFFFKKNATYNLAAESNLLLIHMADGAPQDVLAGRKAHEEWMHDHRFGADYFLYNYIGKVLVNIAHPDYSAYVLAAYDLAALQRLVKLRYEIRRQGIAVNAVPQFIQEHPEWATHPVSKRAFSWNPDKQEIALTPLAKQRSARRFSLPIRE